MTAYHQLANNTNADNFHTLGQKSHFYPKIPFNMRFKKSDFCEKQGSKNVNVKYVILKMLLLRKM